MKLNALKFGVACGIVWGISVFFIALIAKETDVGIGIVDTLGKVYIGEKATWSGAFLGLIYGFFDAGIGGLLVAWVYNLLLGKGSK